jgi:hypothetical protein
MASDPPYPLHPHVVLPVRRDPKGETGPTKGEAAGPRWRRSSHGVYVGADVDDSPPEQRIAEAAAVLPPCGAVTGWAGLCWGGATWFDGLQRSERRPVPIAVLHGEIRPRPGILVTSERLPPRDRTMVDNLPVTLHVRSVCFEMRYAPTEREAVVILDMAMMDDLVSVEEVAAYVATLNGWIGVGKCRLALVLADENSWSAMETRFRLVWVLDCELPHPLCNRPVFDLRGRHVGTPDLLDLEAGLVGEYEGDLHLQGRRRAKDLQKEAAYRRLGLEYVAMVAADQESPETTIIPRVLEARSRARFEAESVRQWTVVPPAWWTSTTTVETRRALGDRQRGRLLRYRVS